MRNLSHLAPIGLRSCEFDLTKADSFRLMLETHRPDVLIHCAARGGKQSLGRFEAQDLVDNLNMAENLYQFSDRIGTIINIGSGAEYGIDNDISFVSEKHLVLNITGIPRDSYGLSKRLVWQRLSGLNNSITLRVFGCFDPTEPAFRLLRRFVDAASKGEEFVLKQDRKFSWISGLDLSRLVGFVIGDLGSRFGWLHGRPCNMNVAYPETSNMLLSELLDRWCFLKGITPSYRIEDPEIGRSYTCDTKSMESYLRKNTLLGLDHCLGLYE